MKKLLTSQEIAKVCHEVNKSFCECMGDFSQRPWDKAPMWQKESAMNGVEFHISNPDACPESSHINWYQQKVKDGWVYGEIKDTLMKTHPCMLDYCELPVEQKAKDFIFKSIVEQLDSLT